MIKKAKVNNIITWRLALDIKGKLFYIADFEF